MEYSKQVTVRSKWAPHRDFRCNSIHSKQIYPSAKTFWNSDKRISPVRGCQERTFPFPPPRVPQNHEAPVLVIPKDSEGDSWGFARNFKTSNGSLRMPPTSNRGRLWKLRFLGPNPTFAGFLVIPKDSEGDSWGFARNFKTSNGSLRMPPTSNRGRLWKLRFLGPNPTFAGFLVIPKDSEGDSWVSTRGNP